MSDTTRDTAVLLLISALMSYIHADETTPKIDKLRKQIRKGVNTLAARHPDIYVEAAKLSNDTWTSARDKLEGDHRRYGVHIHLMVLSLYRIIEGHTVATKWFTQRTLYEAMRSMETRSGKVVGEQDSYALTEIFSELLGYNTSTAFAERVRMMREHTGENKC